MSHPERERGARDAVYWTTHDRPLLLLLLRAPKTSADSDIHTTPHAAEPSYSHTTPHSPGIPPGAAHDRKRACRHLGASSFSSRQEVSGSRGRNKSEPTSAFFLQQHFGYEAQPRFVRLLPRSTVDCLPVKFKLMMSRGSGSADAVVVLTQCCLSDS